MGVLKTLLAVVAVYTAVLVVNKAPLILSPANGWREARCWAIQFADSMLCPYDLYTFRPAHTACVDELKHEFPHGTEWDFDLEMTELTVENMTEYLTKNADALQRPFVIRGFLHQPGTQFDLTKYADLEYLRSHVNGSHLYNFAAKEESHERITMPEAIDKMLIGTGLYMKFNRDFTNNEEVVRNAVDAATARLVELGGPAVEQALADAMKVTFMTIGDQMETPLHNAMSDNWFFQIAGSKKWDLYDPRHSIYLQPFNVPNAIASGSNWDPTFKNGPRVLNTVTNAGDFLYFPSFWLHAVKNNGPGMHLAVGLRPSLSGVKNMFKSALVPFFEDRKGTAGLAYCHLGVGFKIILDSLKTRVQNRWDAVFSVGSHTGLDLSDRDRGTNWWIKVKQGQQKAVDEIKDSKSSEL